MIGLDVRAVLVGSLVDISGSIVVGGAILAFAGAVMGATSPEQLSAAFDGSTGLQALSLVLGLAFVSLGAYVAARVARTAERLHAFAVGIISTTVGFAVVFVVPKINEVKSEKMFFSGVRVRVPEGSELRTLCMPDASHIYYSGRSRVPNMQSEEDLKTYLSSTGEVFCIMEYDDYLTHRVRGIEKLTLVFKARAGRKTLAVVTNRPR